MMLASSTQETLLPLTLQYQTAHISARLIQSDVK
jgi:hypothetical protein